MKCQTRGRRRIALMAVGVLAAGALALPSQGAAKPIPATSAALTVDGPPFCHVTATYTWENFKRVRTMVLEITDVTANHTTEFREAVAGGAKSGTISHFVIGLGGNSYTANGHLENKKGQEVANSDRGTGAPQQVSNSCL